MISTPSTIERAIELATAGSCRTVSEIRQRLRKEQFDMVDQHLSGSVLQRKLRALIAARRIGPTKNMRLWQSLMCATFTMVVAPAMSTTSWLQSNWYASPGANERGT